MFSPTGTRSIIRCIIRPINWGYPISPIPLYHTRSSCVIRGQKWLCHTVYDKTKVFFGASYPVTSTAKPCICIRSQKTVPNNLVGRCRHNHTTITPVHAHQKIPLFYHKTYDTTIYFSGTKTKCFPLLELGVSYAVSYAQLIGVILYPQFRCIIRGRVVSYADKNGCVIRFMIKPRYFLVLHIP